LLEDARALAAGLTAYGFAPGDRAAIVGAFGAETFRGILAIWAAGGTAVPFDRTVGVDDLRDALRASRVRLALAADRPDLDRLLLARPDLPDLELVFVFRAGEGDRPSPARTVREVTASGRAILDASPGAYSDPPAVPGVLVLGASAEGPATLRRGLDDLDRRTVDLATRMRIESSDRVLLSLPLTGGVELDAARAVLEAGGDLVFAERDEPDPGALATLRPTRTMIRRSGIEALERALGEEIDRRGRLGRTLAAWAFRAVAERERHPKRARLADRWVLKDFGDRVTGGRLVEATCPGPPPHAPRLRSIGVHVRSLDAGA
jgi:hypothetical protein